MLGDRQTLGMETEGGGSHAGSQATPPARQTHSSPESRPQVLDTPPSGMVSTANIKLSLSHQVIQIYQDGEHGGGEFWGKVGSGVLDTLCWKDKKPSVVTHTYVISALGR